MDAVPASMACWIKPVFQPKEGMRVSMEERNGGTTGPRLPRHPLPGVHPARFRCDPPQCNLRLNSSRHKRNEWGFPTAGYADGLLDELAGFVPYPPRSSSRLAKNASSRPIYPGPP